MRGMRIATASVRTGLAMTEKWGRCVPLHVILSEPEASRRIRGFTIPPSVLRTATSLYTREAYKERILRLRCAALRMTEG